MRSATAAGTTSNAFLLTATTASSPLAMRWRWSSVTWISLMREPWVKRYTASPLARSTRLSFAIWRIRSAVSLAWRCCWRSASSARSRSAFCACC
jgi:hypothetical protein